jgi:hypothetical protein
MQIVLPEWERPDLTPEQRREAFMAAVREAQMPDPVTRKLSSARQIARRLNVKVAAVRACTAFYDYIWI